MGGVAAAVVVAGLLIAVIAYLVVRARQPAPPRHANRDPKGD